MAKSTISESMLAKLLAVFVVDTNEMLGWPAGTQQLICRTKRRQRYGENLP